MNRALEALFADLLLAGVTLNEARDVRRSYERALRRQRTSGWIGFYRAVFEALNGTAVAAFPQSAMRRPARASLLRLLEDDLGSTLFSESEMANLRARLDESQAETPAIIFRPRSRESFGLQRRSEPLQPAGGIGPGPSCQVIVHPRMRHR
jgi:hypothetical protein